MKKTLKALLCLALCSIMFLALVGCGNTKKDDWTKDVIGEWELSNSDDKNNALSIIYTFFPDGTGKKYARILSETASITFTWTTKEPNIIVVVRENGETEELEYYDDFIEYGSYFFYKFDGNTQNKSQQTEKKDWTNDITGKWERTSKGYYNTTVYTYTFYPNGTGLYFVISNDNILSSNLYEFDWTTEERNKIIVDIWEFGDVLLRTEELEYNEDYLSTGSFYYFKVTG